MSDAAEAEPRRGGSQLIPRPQLVRPGPPSPWSRPGASPPQRITVAAVRVALERWGPPSGPPVEIPNLPLPGPVRRPAAVLCALFDEDGEAQVLLTRRSARLRSHTSEVSFPGGRLDSGEAPLEAALREAHEEVGLDPATVEVLGRLSTMHTMANRAPILPFVAALPGRPVLHPNPAEVERAFTVPLVELSDPDVYREELWTLPDGVERSMHFFELVGDTVWGATARMLRELLDVVFAPG